MNPVVIVVVVLTLVLFAALFAAISLVGFIPDDLLEPEGRRHGGASGHGRPG